MNNRILIITYYWPPSGGAGVQRWLKFTKYLPEYGIQPYVLTVKNPTYPFPDESLNQEVSDKVVVEKSLSIEPFALYGWLTGKDAGEVGSPVTGLKGEEQSWLTRLSQWIRANVFIPDARRGWVPFSKRKALQMVRKYDIGTVVTTGPPHSVHFIGSYLQRKTGIRWIGDFRDPWVDVHYNLYLPRTRPAIALDRRYERRTLEKVDEAIVVSETMAKQFRNLYDRSYHVLTNGYDPADFPSEETGQEEIFTIRYVGKLGETVIPYGLIEAMSGIDAEIPFRVEFIGNVHSRLPELVREHGLKDIVTFRPYMPMKEANRELCKAHLQLLILPDTPGNELILSGKLFNYIGAGRPILMIGPNKGDAAKIIKDYNFGACFEHNEVDEIRIWLKEALTLYKKEGKIMQKDLESGSSAPEIFSRKYLTGELAGLIKKYDQ